MRDAPERPLLRPWVSLDPEPVLFYADAAGRTRALRLDALDLAHLALSLAEAQVTMRARALDIAVKSAQVEPNESVPMQPLVAV